MPTSNPSPQKLFPCLHVFQIFLVLSILSLSTASPRTTLVRQSLPPNFQPRTLDSLIESINSKPLTTSEKLSIINTATSIISNINPHRFLHLNLYKVDVVKQLRTYATRLEKEKNPTKSNAQFHNDMISIFQQMNDRHTVYLPPKPLSRSIALLDFAVRRVYSRKSDGSPDTKNPTYIAVSVGTFGLGSANLTQSSTFVNGVKILAWDTVDIHLVIRKKGKDGYGSNLSARTDNALRSLTLLLLPMDPLPKNPIAVVTYESLEGVVDTVQIPWAFFELPVELFDVTSRMAVPVTIPHLHFSPVVLKSFFWKSRGHEVWESIPETVRVAEEGRRKIGVRPQFSHLFSAFVLNTSSGSIGYLALPSFGSFDVKAVVAELSRILKQMPENGLVIDLRGNMGGNPAYVKALIELLWEGEVPEMPFSVRATELYEKVFRGKPTNLTSIYKIVLNGGRASAAVRTAIRAGEPFTGPIGDALDLATRKEDRSVRQKRVYFGPMISVIDGLTYSAGDMFTSLQVDRNISLVVGTSDNVGAGGASTVAYSLASRLAPGTLKPLPGDVDFTTAHTRFFRTGSKSGAMVEFFGVKPHIRYYPTFNDAVNGDCDLVEYLGRKMRELAL